MDIVSTIPETIKASETRNDTDIEDTATELLGSRKFVVESYSIDGAEQESDSTAVSTLIVLSALVVGM